MHVNINCLHVCLIQIGLKCSTVPAKGTYSCQKVIQTRHYHLGSSTFTTRTMLQLLWYQKIWTNTVEEKEEQDMYKNKICMWLNVHHADERSICECQRSRPSPSPLLPLLNHVGNLMRGTLLLARPAKWRPTIPTRKPVVGYICLMIAKLSEKFYFFQPFFDIES